ncbi:type II toxin-antitoxin system VapB family antitoxin [Glycomyces halotolerans]
MLDIKGGAAVTRTVIDIDDGLLSEVSQALGTSTKKETVNAALREVLETRRRAIALTRLRVMVADGAVDASLFEDKRNYRR